MKKYAMKKITVLFIGYMLAVALCATGIILNSDIASASNGGIFGGTKSTALDIILWALIVIFTVVVLITSAVMYKNSKPNRSNS